MKDSPNIALIVVDYQVDFCEGGALPVTGALAICPEINRAIVVAQTRKWPIIFTRDWHPSDHSSFKAHGGPWPQHCVVKSRGACFEGNMIIPEGSTIISTGTEVEGMGYSPFENEILHKHLKENNVTRLIVGGLALEYCVKSTCIDARNLGYEVILLESITRSITQNTQEIDMLYQELEARGCVLVENMKLLQKDE